MKKKIIVVLSVLAALAAAIAAIVVFRKQIEDFLESVKRKVGAKKPAFTQEEVEAFADI